MSKEIQSGETIPLTCLQAALTRLMTRYAVRPDSEAAAAVARLLEVLVHHPAVVGEPVLHNSYGRVLGHWGMLVRVCEEGTVGRLAASRQGLH